jgi:hypothetical protein
VDALGSGSAMALKATATGDADAIQAWANHGSRSAIYAQNAGANGYGLNVVETGANGTAVLASSVSGIAVDATAGSIVPTIRTAGTGAGVALSGSATGNDCFTAATTAANKSGVFTRGTGTGSYGVFAQATNTNGVAVHADAQGTGGIGVDCSSTGSGGIALRVNGFTHNNGPSVVGPTSYRIDNPVNPAGEYLVHSAVESSEMKNIYDGVVVLDSKGDGIVALPDWFDALNGDFRYQLTAIGAPAPGLYVSQEISDNRFRIAGGRAGQKVSWMVTGVRKDPVSKMYETPVVQAKTGEEAGLYAYPEAYNQPQERGIVELHRRQAAAASSTPQASPAPTSALNSGR